VNRFEHCPTCGRLLIYGQTCTCGTNTTKSRLPPGAIITVTCCRDWPVLIATPVGRCGYCGTTPTPTPTPKETQP
jgi:hypothetical protein